jgi:hypothetical protein
MLLEGASERDVATTLAVTPLDVQHIVQRAISSLRLSSAAAEAV